MICKLNLPEDEYLHQYKKNVKKIYINRFLQLMISLPINCLKNK